MGDKKQEKLEKAQQFKKKMAQKFGSNKYETAQVNDNNREKRD